jgi:hypothetical protein
MSHRSDQKMSGGTLAAIILTSYLLSPFPVVRGVSRIYGGLFHTPEPVGLALYLFYSPIIFAGEHCKPIQRFYDWGLDRFDPW